MDGAGVGTAAAWGSFGAKSVGPTPTSCWAVGLQDRGGSPGSSLVDGKRARRRPVAPSYRALEAGAQERALEKELQLDFPKSC